MATVNGSRAMPSAVMADFAGLVLAGGASSRMGEDKALLRHGQESLLALAVRRLTAAGADPVLVSGDRPAYDCVPDQQPGLGPLGGLASVLAERPGLGGRVLLVTAVDTPGLGADELLALVRNLGGGEPGVYFQNHPLPLALRVTPALQQCLGKLLAEGRGAPVHRLAAAMGFRHLSAEHADLRNINTPQDWQAFQAGREAAP